VVDTASRNLQIRASFANPDHAAARHVRHGRSRTGAPQNYVTLPQTAITYNPRHHRETRGDQVAILKRRQGRPDRSSPAARSS
jgi:hypothetical protein